MAGASDEAAREETFEDGRRLEDDHLSLKIIESNMFLMASRNNNLPSVDAEVHSGECT